MMIINQLKCIAVAGFLACVAFQANAAEHEVKMLNKGSDGNLMVFEPAFLKIEPGDSVTFLATNPTHNAESILGMVPEKAPAFKGKINEEITVTFDAPGVYGYKCLPHYAMGMVGLIQVGDDLSNLHEAQKVKHPGRAAGRMALLFEKVSTAEDKE